MLNLIAWWVGYKLDLMLADVCGGGTYMCCSFLYISGFGFLVSVRLLRDVLEFHYAHVVLYHYCCLAVLHLLYFTHLLAQCVFVT